MVTSAHWLQKTRWRRPKWPNLKLQNQVSRFSSVCSGPKAGDVPLIYLSSLEALFLTYCAIHTRRRVSSHWLIQTSGGRGRSQRPCWKAKTFDLSQSDGFCPPGYKCWFCSNSRTNLLKTNGGFRGTKSPESYFCVCFSSFG